LGDEAAGEGLGVDLQRARRIAAPDDGIRPAEWDEAPRFSITIDETSESASIYQQIIDQIREGVATGALEAGRRLQTVRSLADALDIAPGTVARAYAELERLGVVVTEGARGTRVAEPRRPEQLPSERLSTLTGLLRPVAVAAFHMGGSAAELRQALDAAMKGIMEEQGDSV
jgi:DNA-binding transcriptional regulator YhcF (GntR family)